MICAQLRRCGASRGAAPGRGARAARRRRRPGRGAARTRRRLVGVAAPLPLRARYWWRRRRGAVVDVPAPRRRGLAGARSDWRRAGACLLRRRAGGLGRAGTRTCRSGARRLNLHAIAVASRTFIYAQGHYLFGAAFCSKRMIPRTGRPCTWCAVRTASASRHRSYFGGRPIPLTCGRSGKGSKPTTPRARGRAC